MSIDLFFKIALVCKNCVALGSQAFEPPAAGVSAMMFESQEVSFALSLFNSIIVRCLLDSFGFRIADQDVDDDIVN